MHCALRHILWGICCVILLNPVAIAQLRLPDTSARAPNLTIDPFESSRAKKTIRNSITLGQPISNDDEEEESESQNTETQDLDAETDVTQQEDVAEEQEEGQEANKPHSNGSELPYSYTLFLDVDYVYKFSGGASSDPMGDDPDAVPPSSVTVGLLHFYGEFSTAKADWWDNGTFVLHMIYGEGESPTGTVGDLRSVSNIDASFMSDGQMVMPGLDILELWYEHAFPLSKSSMRFGIGYLSSDFYKSKYTGLFLTSGINSIGTEILWNTMASNPPNTTIGLWYKSKLSENLYGQAVVFEGLPDHSTKVFDVKFDESEGAFFATEFGWQEGIPKQEGYLKVGVGAWYLSQRIKNNMMIGIRNYPGDPIATRGYYTVIDKAFDNNIGMFFKGGIADNGINKYRHYFTTGLTYKGLIPSRPGDTAGIAVVQSKLSDNYIKFQGSDESGNITMYSEETIYEFTYSISVNNWLMIQPDIQYVMQPGMNPMNENALVGILRAEITLL